jgi:hypothetical protein
MLMVTDFLTGRETSLFLASHVSSASSSVLARSERTTVEVTVLPEDTSEEEGRRRPLRSHITDGLGRPAKKKVI